MFLCVEILNFNFNVNLNGNGNYELCIMHYALNKDYALY